MINLFLIKISTKVVKNSTVFIDSNLVSNSDIKLNGLKQINQERYLVLK